MDTAKFWSLVHAAGSQADGDCELQVALLVKALSALSPEEILESQQVLDALMAQSYQNELWAAAYLINGGCSDDCFDYFRGWLIAQGEAIFARALQDPESLVEAAGPAYDREGMVECESMLYVPADAYQSATGQELPLVPRAPHQLTGAAWDEDTVDQLYPRLAARFA